MTDTPLAGSRPPSRRRPPQAWLRRLLDALPGAAERLRATDRRLVTIVAAASVAIIAAGLQTGYEAAGSALVAALWLRVGADAVTVEPVAPASHPTCDPAETRRRH